MKLAILGGSFNPIHLGHLHLAEEVIKALNYDRILLIPAYKSPLKTDILGASPKDRIDMICASIFALPWLSIDDCEIKREGVSYTIETLTAIYEQYKPEGKIGLILGDDLADSFPKWKQAKEIAALADIIIAHRMSAAAIAFPYAYKSLNNEMIDISSNIVRSKIENNQAWEYLVPEGARRIITDRGIYQNGAPADSHLTWELIAAVEYQAFKKLGSNRFLHSRNTALLCTDLCMRFGLDTKQGYLAGISHDMCKSMSETELVSLAPADGKRISKLEREKPGLLHGRAAAIFLKQHFNITNEAILGAVRQHTVGDLNMDTLAKILYVADKLEVSRNHANPKLQAVLGSASLDELFEGVLSETVTYLKSNEMSISYQTRRLFSEMNKKQSRYD
ncbi:nicotinate (nicotinamide) nucleotide adenylyltransferase [Breznakiellaceae bacterium SP9]